MKQTKIAMLLIAIGAAGMIGIGTTEHAFAQHGGGFGAPVPGQNDNSQGNSNNQQAGSCGFRNDQSNCQNVQGNQN